MIHPYCPNHPTDYAKHLCVLCGQVFCMYCIAPQVIQVVKQEWAWNAPTVDYVLTACAPERAVWMVCHGCMAKMPPYYVLPASPKPLTFTINTNTTTPPPRVKLDLGRILGNLLVKGEVTIGSTTRQWNPYPDYYWGKSPITFEPVKKQTRRGHHHKERNVLEEDLAAFLEAEDE